MSKNGFYHERPNDYDISVAEHMISEVGARQINWHVQNASWDGMKSVADVEWPGKPEKTFVAVRYTCGADHYWRIERLKKDMYTPDAPDNGVEA